MIPPDPQSYAQWARTTATLPLAFAQVREDPRLDLEVAQRLDRPAAVVMIASGGDTAVCLGRLPLRSLIVVDINPAQLALTRLKWHLAQNCLPDESMAVLGHRVMELEERKARLSELLPKLGASPSIFGPLDPISSLGPDRAGRYERLFAELQFVLAPHAKAIADLLNTYRPADNASCFASGNPFGEALDAALAEVMSLENLIALFGPEATRNPRQPFHRHFAQRLRHVLATLPAVTNPFLWQFLQERFPPGLAYDWLHGSAMPAPMPRFHHGSMHDALAAMDAESADLVHLSNILDWLSVEDATACLRHAARVLRPGGYVILRQLNSTLDIPTLPCGLQWDEAWGRELHAKDRSFFYTAIHLGRKL